MAIGLNTRDQSGLTFEERKRVLDFVPLHELYEVGFDPSNLEFEFHRDYQSMDIAVRVKNKKTSKAMQRIIPEHFMAMTTITPPSNGVSQVYATTLAANPNGNYVLSTSNGVNWSDIMGNTAAAAVNISQSDIVIQGKSLKDFMAQVEERLAILQPAKDLEEEWVELRELRKQYMEAEQKIREKMKTWELLNKDAK